MKLLDGNIERLHELQIRKDFLRHKYPCCIKEKINFTTLKLETSFLQKHNKDSEKTGSLSGTVIIHLALLKYLLFLLLFISSCIFIFASGIILLLPEELHLFIYLFFISSQDKFSQLFIWKYLHFVFIFSGYFNIGIEL